MQPLQDILKAIKPSRRPSSYAEHDYLVGVRGLLTIQTFLWTFLSLFVPGAVKTPTTETQSPGPFYATVLRKTFSVLFWNDALIYSFIIFLSARTICLPFISNPSSQQVSGAVFRRGVRLWFPCAFALGLSWLCVAQTGYATIGDFLARTRNTNVAVPYEIPDFLVYFNSVFDLFWTTKAYASQAGARAFPTGTLWIVSVVFMQSHTVYMTMVVIPYTRNSWRVKAFVAFVVAAWWVQSWAWYSVSALLLADVVANMDFRYRALDGVYALGGRVRIPAWLIYGVMVLAGVIMQYLWTAWRPEYANEELKGHTGLYNSGSLNAGLDMVQPMARDDNYLIVLGFFLFLETYDGLRWIFGLPFLVALGRRSFSYFLFTPPILYSAGVKLFFRLRVQKNWPLEPSVGITFLTMLPLIIVGSEIFYRTVDYPSQALGRTLWNWIRD